jgi:RAD50-interacting protein 1
MVVQFFVDLWNELQKKAKTRDIDDNITGKMSYSEVRNSTSASMGSDADGGIFDETICAYKKNCRDRAEYLMIDAIKHNFPRALRPYINKTQWLAIDDESDAGA